MGHKESYISSLKRKYPEDYEKIKDEIYSRCYINFGRDALFPFFVNSVEGKSIVMKRDLVILVSSVLDDLICKGILEISRDCSSEGSVYAFYRVKSKEGLPVNNGFLDKKFKLLN